MHQTSICSTPATASDVFPATSAEPKMTHATAPAKLTWRLMYATQPRLGGCPPALMSSPLSLLSLSSSSSWDGRPPVAAAAVATAAGRRRRACAI
jgi:hypothetical protein